MKTSKKGIQFLKEQEGLRLNAYRDTNGTWTIGYGRTSAVGVPVKKGDVISEDQAERFLLEDIRKYEKDINNFVQVKLNQSQFDALLSWHYNTGALATSTLLKLLNKGKYDRVPNEMSKWVKETIGGKKVDNRGLVARRAREAALWVAEDKPLPTSSTSVARATPPVVSKENITFAASILAGNGAAIESAVTGDGYVQIAVAIAIFAATIIGVIYFMKRRGA